MLPKEIPQLPHLDIAVYMKTATEVGGDYYDFRVSPDGTLNVALGDATGHGMQAGTLVTIMKGIFTIEADNNEVLPFFQKSVQAIKEIKLGRLMMAFAFLKIKGNQLSLSIAGVPPVYIFRNKKKEVEEIDNKGMPLGAMNDFPYEETKTELDKGDVVFLLSDGFPELSNNNKEVFGYERLRKTFNEIGERSAEEIIEHLKSTVKEWSGGKVPDDDVTFVVIKVK
jgi:serine phosphatase RsbU (regulator of sigma subunit)